MEDENDELISRLKRVKPLQTSFAHKKPVLPVYEFIVKPVFPVYVFIDEQILPIKQPTLPDYACINHPSRPEFTL